MQLILSSYELMLALFALVFSMEGVAVELVQVAHAVRELIEREKGTLLSSFA